SSFDIRNAGNVARLMTQPVLNLAGKTTLSRSISVIKKASLFISTDTGPVHIAAALHISQVVLFGRNQKGLSPVRWGPLGGKNKILHRPLGCEICLAHDCAKDFACLKAITVDDVIAAADELLSPC
ncbi:MAG: glycosyltransferase family 9 protein, partial [Candidatus Omnitrophica bacterium]|nr:glycosyltransferase family 9 protein [Candidatus Omnitrophota bacterium]